MKKKYETPQIEVTDLYMQAPLLLPASSTGSTDESLSRGFGSDGEDSAAGYHAWDDDESF